MSPLRCSECSEAYMRSVNVVCGCSEHVNPPRSWDEFLADLTALEVDEFVTVGRDWRVYVVTS